jgi:hypothetical protein
MPSITIARVRCWLQGSFEVPGDFVQIRGYFPEDFLIVFSYFDDMLRVLRFYSWHAPTSRPNQRR